MEKSLKKCLGFTREPAALEQKSIHPLQFDQESLDGMIIHIDLGNVKISFNGYHRLWNME